MAKGKTEFSLSVYYDDFDRNFDKKLEKLLGPRDSSGFLIQGERDMEWIYPTREAANAAIKQLKKATAIMDRLTRVELTEWRDDWDNIVGVTNVK